MHKVWNFLTNVNSENKQVTGIIQAIIFIKYPDHGEKFRKLENHADIPRQNTESKHIRPSGMLEHWELGKSSQI